MRVLIEGAGSAALRLARASDEVGLEVRILSTRPRTFEKFSDRHKEKFGLAPSARIRPSCTAEAFGLILIATPGGAHASSLLKIKKAWNEKAVEPLLFFEKPLLLEPSSALHHKIACLSQMTFDEGFHLFVQRIARKAKVTGISRIEAQFKDSLDSAVSAHPWLPDLRSGWITDDRRGGGALNEYCHPFFWTGEVLRASDMSFPKINLKEATKLQLADSECTVSASLEGSIGNTRIKISQEILSKGQKARKDIRVTFEDKVEVGFDWSTGLSGYSTEKASRNLINHLASLECEKGVGPHNDVALWADEALGGFPVA